MDLRIECYRGVVHPWLCDAMGHMTTRHYTAMFDDASYHMLASIGYSSEHLTADIGFADVRITTEFVHELSTGDLVVIFGEIGRVGTKSLTLQFEMQNIATNERAARCEIITTQFDLNARRAVEIIPEVRKICADMAPD